MFRVLLCYGNMSELKFVLQITVFIGSSVGTYDEDDDEITAHPDRYGRRSPSPAFDFDEFFAQGEHETLSVSQMGGAPVPTQATQDEDATPVPTGRPTRQIVPPSPLTYSAGHVRAGRGRRAPRPGTVMGVAPKRGRF